ncbi:MAG: SDR family NAD(P)-dependent oxidoreductase, partial [Gemmatimonadales bacterium]
VTGVEREGQIGHAVARALGDAGASLVIADRSPEGLDERLREFTAAGLAAVAAPGDLTDPPTARGVVSLAETRFGGLDIVVNVAGGLTSYGPFDETELAALDRELAINLRTVFCVCHAAVPALRRRGGGAIVNFSSIGALRPQPNLAAYTAAKAGVAGLTRALARELRDDKIRVNALAPAAVRTTTNVADMGADASLVPMADVVEAVRFLASSAAASITGHILPVGGARP